MTANEYLLLKKYARRFKPPILEVGSFHVSKLPSPRKLFPEQYIYIGIDQQEGRFVDVVHDMELPLNFKFNTIICCSVLEHTQRPWVVAKNIQDSLNTGGHLYVSAPFCWRYHEYPEDYWRFTHSAFETIFDEIEFDFIKYAGIYPKGVHDTYLELSNTVKDELIRESTAIAMLIGMGTKK